MRIKCSQCQRPRGHCLCEYLYSFELPLPVTIFQHPSENQFAFKTAHLARLQLPGLKLLEGDTFTPPQAKRPILLYASEKSLPLSSLNESPDHLLLLDGTWKKTHKLLRLNPWLQEIPQYHLELDITSRLAPLRLGPKPHALSTLEALAYSLVALTKREGYLQLVEVLEYWSQLQAKASAK